MSLAPQFGQEVEIKSRGRTLKMVRLDKSIWDQMLEWAEPKIRNPLKDLQPIVKDLHPDVALKLIRECLDKCPRVVTLHHPLFQEVCNSIEGQVHQFWLQLRPNHPEITEDEVLEMLMEIGEDAAREATIKSAGKPPPRKKKGEDGRARAAGDEAAGGLQSVASDHSVSSLEVSSPALGNPTANFVGDARIFGRRGAEPGGRGAA